MFDKIRRHYNLPTTDSYGIPEKIQTGYFAELYQSKPSLTIDPESPTFYTELKGIVLTPAALYELLPIDKQAEFLWQFVRREAR